MSGVALFAGLPHTGKTTYLALLNLAMTKGQGVVLTLGSFKDDRNYVNDLAGNLFACEPPARTNVDEARGLTLSVKLPDGRPMSLQVPDSSGEVWQELVGERTWRSELAERAIAAAGVCVFIHVGRFANDPPLVELRADLDRFGVEGDEEDDNVEHASDQPMGQVALADLLQILGDQFAPPGGRRIALILSAFDVVSTKAPREWLESEAPLVHQLVRGAADRFEVRLFGLSAQGGSFETEGERSALRQLKALDRAYLVRDDGTKTHFDEPVRWAMGID